jgi:hypothetical protein
MVAEKEVIRTKLAIAKPNFSLSMETDEKLDKARKVFEELLEDQKS